MNQISLSTIYTRAGLVVLAMLLLSAMMCFGGCASTHPYQGCYVGKPLVKADSTKDGKKNAIGAKQTGHINA